MSFESLNLHPIIARNLSLMGYRQPRPIQAQAIGPMLEGRDVIGLAKTGTGKTAAFIVPFAHHLISHVPRPAGGPRGRRQPIEPISRLRALVLCPTRELAQQVGEEAGRIVQGSVLRVAVAYGKVAMSPQAKAIARGVDLLVATPGRVRELIDDGALSLAHIRHVAIDEADRMLDMGFLPQVERILELTPQEGERQTALFTATMPGEVEELAQRFLREPARIEVDPHTTPVEHVEQHLLPVADDDKVDLLLHLLRDSQPPRRGVLVFCRTKRRVGWVGTALQRNEFKIGMLHGDRSQAQRKKAFDRFANRELHVLVATDVAARGLHVPAVKTVVNYDLPLTAEEYVHRIGRAAHGGGHGESYTLLSDDREERLRWRAIVDKLGLDVHAEELPGFEPSKPISRTRRTQERREEEKPMSRRALRRLAEKSRPSKKSRPIKKGQKPGTGVVRRRAER